MKCLGVSAPLTAVLFTALLLSLISYSLLFLPPPPAPLLQEDLLQEAVETIDYLVTLADKGPVHLKETAVITVPPNSMIIIDANTNSISWKPATTLHFQLHNPKLVAFHNATSIGYNSTKVKLTTSCTLGPGVHRLTVELFSLEETPILVQVSS